MANRRSWDLAHVALGLYLLSLVLPALVVVDRPLFGGGERLRTWFGLHCLALGWILWPGWLSNPLFAIAYSLHRWKRPTAAAVVAVLALVSALFGIALVQGLDKADFMRLDHLHVGCVVWLASFVVLVIVALKPPRFREPHEL